MRKRARFVCLVPIHSPLTAVVTTGYAMQVHQPPLKFLSPAWFSIVMGLSGLALAWLRAQTIMGEPARWLAMALGAVAATVFVVLLVLSVRRAQQFGPAVAEDINHPVRHAFVAAVPVGLLLLLALFVQIVGPTPWLNLAWYGAASAQLVVTWWVLSRWLKPGTPDSSGSTAMWPGITPVLFIPVVGNVVAPLAGLALGHETWSVMQLAIAVFFWPIVLGLVLARRAAHSALPPKLLPTWFITVAPPSVLGVVMLQLGAPAWLVQMAWALAAFSLAWALPVLRKAAAEGFHMGFWALSFPMAAFTSLSFGVAQVTPGNTALAAAAMLALVVTNVVVFMLAVSTWRGLRAGSLLVPEVAPSAVGKVIPVVPVQAS